MCFICEKYRGILLILLGFKKNHSARFIMESLSLKGIQHYAYKVP